jgi:hypothetical protein
MCGECLRKPTDAASKVDGNATAPGQPERPDVLNHSIDVLPPRFEELDGIPLSARLGRVG